MMILLAAVLLTDCSAADPTGVVWPNGDYTVGEVEPSWCKAGIDLGATAGPDASAPMQMVVHYTERSTGVERFQRTPFAPPANWLKMGEVRGIASPNGDFVDLLFQFSGEHIVTVSPLPAWRAGYAICAIESAPIQVYYVGKGAPDARDREAIDVILSARARQDPLSVVCESVVPVTNGDYRMRFHSSRGAIADEGVDYHVEFVPVGDVERYRPPPIDSDDSNLHRM